MEFYQVSGDQEIFKLSSDFIRSITKDNHVCMIDSGTKVL